MPELNAQNRIDDAALDALIAAHDGDMALLYLYRLRGDTDREGAARALCRTLQDIGAAEEKLRRLGLLPAEDSAAAQAAPSAAPSGRTVSTSPAKEEPAAPPEQAGAPLPPAQELPEYTADEISRRSRGNSALTVIYQEAAQVMGRTLSGNDLRVLFGIYDHLGLPAEVIVELLHWCGELCREKYGESRRPSPRFLQQEAYAWADREIMTLEQAEEHIRAYRQRKSDLEQIRGALQLSALSTTQARDISAWLDQGFGEDAICLAADRTLTNTGALKWNYLRKILQSWHERGLHTTQEIQEKDPARSAAAKSPEKPGKSGEKPLDDAAWAKLLEKI